MLREEIEKFNQIYLQKLKEKFWRKRILKWKDNSFQEENYESFLFENFLKSRSCRGLFRAQEWFTMMMMAIMMMKMKMMMMMKVMILWEYCVMEKEPNLFLITTSPTCWSMQTRPTIIMMLMMMMMMMMMIKMMTTMMIMMVRSMILD